MTLNGDVSPKGAAEPLLNRHVLAPPRDARAPEPAFPSAQKEQL
jgi:hypothetical protein